MEEFTHRLICHYITLFPFTTVAVQMSKRLSRSDLESRLHSSFSTLSIHGFPVSWLLKIAWLLPARYG